MNLPEQRLEPPAPRETEPLLCPYCSEPEIGCGTAGDDRTPECYQNELVQLHKQLRKLWFELDAWKAYALRLGEAGNSAILEAFWQRRSKANRIWTTAKESKP